MKKIIMMMGILVATLQFAYAQSPADKKPDSTQKGLLPYEKVITANAKSKNGLFTVTQVDVKYFFEIPDSLLKRYMLVVTRYSATPQGLGNFGGEKSQRTDHLL